MTNGGAIAAIVLTPIGVMWDWDDPLQSSTIVWAAFVLLACLVAVIGCFTTRFELVVSANKTLQATAATPHS
jgi:hypothetical protein